jgi:hypothetical protein
LASTETYHLKPAREFRKARIAADTFRCKLFVLRNRQGFEYKMAAISTDTTTYYCASPLIYMPIDKQKRLRELQITQTKKQIKILAKSFWISPEISATLARFCAPDRP